MGLFMDPRRAPNDTKASYARRRAPWLVVAAIGCTYYVLSKGNVSFTGGMAMLLVWVAAVLAVSAADWSDLHRK